MTAQIQCRLCGSQRLERVSHKNGHAYHSCKDCRLIQLDENLWLPPLEEKKRYLLHENSSENKGYIEYLVHIINNSLLPFMSTGETILDFGCGPEITWADLLNDRGFLVSTYDPFFDNIRTWTEQKFDGITAIEVFEHIRNPNKEICTLNGSLKQGSYLIIRTLLHNDCLKDFFKWWYREDPTHISFFHEQTFDYICSEWAYQKIQILNNCEVVLRKL